MSKTFYLAGKVAGNKALQELPALSTELESRGHLNIYPWWQQNVKKPYLEYRDHNALLAQAMVKAAYEAEVFMLFASPDLLGASIEYGVALTASEYQLDKRIYVIGALATRQSIFYTPSQVEVIPSVQSIRETDWY